MQQNEQVILASSIPPVVASEPRRMWFTKVAQMYQTNIRVHAAMNVPAHIMVQSMDKLNDLFHRAEAAYANNHVQHLESLFDQLKHFDEPAGVQAYHGEQFQQKVLRVHSLTNPGNR